MRGEGVPDSDARFDASGIGIRGKVAVSDSLSRLTTRTSSRDLPLIDL
jgi:hypothetical protein